MLNCVFCKIISGELSANIVFEDDTCIVFHPLKAVVEGHILIVPKIHFQDMFDIKVEVLEQLISVTKKLALSAIIDQPFTGINLMHASGKDAQQSVFHFHFHLIPRHPGDGLDLWLKNKI